MNLPTRFDSMSTEQFYGAFLAMNALFFAMGAAGTFWAHKLKDPRLQQFTKPSLAKFADFLIYTVRFLSFLVLALSVYLFYSLWRIYPSVMRA